MGNKQYELHLNYGISREQACILCHLSAECSGCCLRCKKDDCQGQRCSQEQRHTDGLRWDTWMYLVQNTLSDLQRFISPELRKKYGIKKPKQTH